MKVWHVGNFVCKEGVEISVRLSHSVNPVLGGVTYVCERMDRSVCRKDPEPSFQKSSIDSVRSDDRV